MVLTLDSLWYGEVRVGLREGRVGLREGRVGLREGKVVLREGRVGLREGRVPRVYLFLEICEYKLKLSLI